MAANVKKELEDKALIAFSQSGISGIRAGDNTAESPDRVIVAKCEKISPSCFGASGSSINYKCSMVVKFYSYIPEDENMAKIDAMIKASIAIMDTIATSSFSGISGLTVDGVVMGETASGIEDDYHMFSISFDVFVDITTT